MSKQQYFAFFLYFLSGIQCLQADGRIDISDGIDIQPSPVIIDQSFDISFELKEHQGEPKQFDEVEIWIQDGSGNDLYKLDALVEGIIFPANFSTTFTYRTTLLSEFEREPGTYRVEVRGVIGRDTFELEGIERGENSKSFEAILPTGRVDVFTHYIPTFPIQQNQEFLIEFALMEHYGYPKTLDDLELWIQDGSGNDLFRAKDWGAENFEARETKRYTAKVDIDSSRQNRDPGTYQSVIRATVGDSTFNFDPKSTDAVSFSDPSGVPPNPLQFDVAAAPVVEGFVDLVTPNIVFDPNQPQAGEGFSFNFSLQEIEGASKSFEYIQVWLSDENNLRNRVYLIADFGAQSFLPNETVSFYKTVSVPENPPIATETNYLIRVWGKVSGDDAPFIFSTNQSFNPNFFLKGSNNGFVDLNGPIKINTTLPSESFKGFDYSYTLSEMRGSRKKFAAIRDSILYPDGTIELFRLSEGTDREVEFAPNESKDTSGGSRGGPFFQAGGRFGYLIEYQLLGSSKWEKFEGANNPQYFDIPVNESVPPEEECNKKDDSDNDGLLDCWEIAGEYKFNGVTALLPGADVEKKDVYVFVDWDPRNEPSEDVFHDVIEAFQNSGVDDGKGINLHIVKSNEGIEVNTPLVVVAKNEDDICEQSWTALDNVRDRDDGKYFNKAMSHIYRYAFVARNYISSNDYWYLAANECSKNKKPLGAAKTTEIDNRIDVQGDSFIVSVTANNEFKFSSTFMHELGHSLGLGHGGIIDGSLDQNICESLVCRDNGIAADLYNNNKPHHVSIMNYSYLAGGISKRNGQTSFLDFQNYRSADLYEKSNPIKEKKIKEDIPLADMGSEIGRLKGYSYCGGLLNELLGRTDQRWRSFWLDDEPDWNCNGKNDSHSYVKDINGDGETSDLYASENEWENLVYKGGSIGGLALENGYDPYAATEVIYEEFTQNDIDEISESLDNIDEINKITVVDYTINWPNDGWYQVQDARNHESICEGGLSCTVERGRYNIINHTTGKRYEDIAVPNSVPESGVIVRGNTIILPTKGWYQVQGARNHESICEGVDECVVGAGIYRVINHTTGKRHEDIVVGESTSDQLLLSESNRVIWPTNKRINIVESDSVVCSYNQECALSPGKYSVVDQSSGKAIYDLNADTAAVNSGVVVTATKIYWPDDGWYGVYDYEGSSICQGGAWCEVDPGSYRVVNHTLAKTFDDIIVSQNSNSSNESLVTINWPDNGWYQILTASDFVSVCEGRTACSVAPGNYIVINHMTGERFRDVIVK